MRATQILVSVAILSVIGALVFLYVWLNAQELLLEKERSELTMRILELKRQVLELEHLFREAISPEALKAWLEEWNSRKARQGELQMAPLPPENIIHLHVEGEGD